MKQGTHLIVYNFDETSENIIKSFRKADETDSDFLIRIVKALFEKRYNTDIESLAEAVNNNTISGNDFFFFAELGFWKLIEILLKNFKIDFDDFFNKDIL